MKIAMVLLAAVALIGSAAAWDDKTWATYESGQEMYMQADDPLPYLLGFESGTYFKGVTPFQVECENTRCTDPVYCQVEKVGAVFNKLTDETEGHLAKQGATGYWEAAGSNPMQVLGVDTDQKLTITQSGSTYLKLAAPNSAAGTPEVEAGLTTKQNLHFSGFYQGMYPNPGVYAQFESEGNVGLPGIAVLTSFTNLENAAGRAQPGMIETTHDTHPDTFFTDADIGMGSSAGMTLDVLTGSPVFSGSVTSFAGFSGGRGTGVIEANAGGFENHVMVHDGNVWTEGFLPGSLYTSVQTGNNYFPVW
jgi:hypothetical protein